MKNIAAKLSPDEYESNFSALKPALTGRAAVVESGRCLYCYDAPCTEACPTHIDVPQFIRKINTRNYLGSARTILSANILGETCSRACPVDDLCEGACVMHEKGERPIQIGQLQRFVMEWRREQGKRLFGNGQLKGKSVGLIGAGPASLSCAASLVRLGHEAVIYEAGEIPGGLAATGIASYKLRMKEVLAEIEMIREMGVTIRNGVRVGEDVSVEQLLEKHHVIFVGVGLDRTHGLAVPGEELEGVIDAISFIHEIKTRPFGEIDVGSHVVVVGGGNTSVDAATAAKRLGAESVMVVYRRSEAEMPAYEHEYRLAKLDGIVYRWLTAPVEIVGEKGVEAVKCIKMELGEVDHSGRRRPIPVEGSEELIKADMVISALGQTADLQFLEQLPQVEISEGLLVADPETGQTANPRIFAGGDLVHGAREVVNAVQAGKLAADGIDNYL